MVKKKIDIVLAYHIRNQKNIIRAAKQQQVAHEKMRAGIQRASVQIAKSQKMQEISGYGPLKVMRMNQKELGNFNELGGRFGSTQARMANRFRMMTHGARGFRMEMLGVMFFGMAIQRVFFGLLKTSMQWAGVWDVLSTALGLLFLPIALKLLDWSLKFLDWVGKLSEEQKLWIGVITLVVAAIGGLIFVIGTLTLGIGSMILAFNFSKISRIIGEQGIGGIQTVAKNATTKMNGLKLSIGNVARLAGAGIALGIMVKDLKAGKVVAALGDALIATGILLPGYGKYIAVAGILLKIFGDEEFMVDTIKIMYRVGDVIHSILKEAVMSGISFRGFDMTNIKGFANVQSAIQQAAEQISMEDAMKGIGDDVIYPIEQINKMWDEVERLNGLIKAGIDVDKYNSEIVSIKKEIENLDKQYNYADTTLKDFHKNIDKTSGKVKKANFSMGGFLQKITGLGRGSVFSGMLGFAKGGIVPGPIGAPVPAIVHGGETVIPNGGSRSGGGGNVSIVVNATVSSDYDVRRLADQLKRYWTNDFEKLTQSRGVS